MAAQKGRLQVARLLLEAKADKDKAMEHGITSLYIAAQKGQQELARLLLEANADKDEATHHGTTPLYIALEAGHLEVASLLLQAKADKDKAMEHGITSLNIAAQKGQQERARLLLEANADKDKARKNGISPLYIAAQQGQQEVACLLLEPNADTDRATHHGTTPLYIAARTGHLEVASLLLEAEADKDTPKDNGCTLCSLQFRLGSWRLHAFCWRPTRTRTRLCMMAPPLCTLRLSKGSWRSILESITGTFQAYHLSAIMGPSGCGKSTLLDVLTGKKKTDGKWTVEGDILINEKKTSIEDIKPVIGFDDVVHEGLTVRENIYYSAAKRMPRGTRASRLRAITNDVLQVLQLESRQNLLVGNRVRTGEGLSGGQKKRVNVGIELAACPTILFLDEPTSGLDATASLMIVQQLKRMARLGVTIVMVIHQPRYDLFTLLDDVLLLGTLEDKGGRMDARLDPRSDSLELVMFWNDRLCLIVGYVSASNVVITRMRTVALAPVSLVASPSSSLSFLLLLLLLLLHLLVLMVVVMVVIEAYMGPTVQAKSHFEHLGLKMPENWNPADWMMDILSGQIFGFVYGNLDQQNCRIPVSDLPAALFKKWQDSPTPEGEAPPRRYVRALSGDTSAEVEIIKQHCKECWSEVAPGHSKLDAEDFAKVLRACTGATPDEEIIEEIMYRASTYDVRGESTLGHPPTFLFGEFGGRSSDQAGERSSSYITLRAFVTYLLSSWAVLSRSTLQHLGVFRVLGFVVLVFGVF
eukprot:s4315_g6.t1